MIACHAGRATSASAARRSALIRVAVGLMTEGCKEDRADHALAAGFVQASGIMPSPSIARP